MGQILQELKVRACLKNHSRNLHAPLCGIFYPNSVAVARYGALIRTKSPTNCDAHLAESLFQTRSKGKGGTIFMKFRVEGIYDAKKLGIPQMLILGLQHMFAMFGATILVPILVNNYFHGEGLSIQVTLFCAGFGTLLFHVLTKLKVPAFLGSSFAFLGGFATVAELDTGIFANMSYGEKLPYACGGV